jgi:outer membrane protein OmpA-like peptidoglycan-associated protein
MFIIFKVNFLTYACSAMKRFILFARVYTSLIFVLPVTLSAQEVLVYPNYVVIGAFAHHKNAIAFTGDANKNKFPARFEMNPNRNLYYVYVLATDDREFAIAEAVKLRAETKYFDTWVYSGALGSLVLAIPGGQPDQDVNPLTGEKMESVSSKENPTASGTGKSNVPGQREGKETAGRSNNVSSKQGQGSIENSNFGSDKTNSDGRSGARISRARIDQDGTRGVVREGGDDDRSGLTAVNPSGEKTESVSSEKDPTASGTGNDTGNLMLGPPPTRATKEPLQAEEVVGKDFYFHIFRADNGKMVGGEVDAIDFERARKMATYPGNKPVTVRMPSGKTKQVSFLCQVFGYRKQQKEFDPNSPAEDLYLDDKGNLVVPFELVRLQKGDIAIMYNVFFFKDAAVMRPESRYEVNNLLELLKENPSYNIKIHGHTNGNANGKIIRMDTPGNFYSLTGTKQGFGSARKLSEERAVVIRDFLISSGISADRMEVQAWGGKKPIHDTRSVRAHENVRVEIEILSQ